MRRIGGWADRRMLIATLAVAIGPSVARAQDSVTVRVPTTASVDSAHPPVHPSAAPLRRPTTPMGAMFRSFLIPGWGQAVYGRKVTAGMMMGVEGLALGMLLKIGNEIHQVAPTDSIRLTAKRQERQDWITIVVFNHLMSGLEAYVSSHLYDFPGDLQLRALPTGGMGVGVTLPIGRR